MIKINNKQKALMLSFVLAALLLPTTLRAQAYDKEAAESYNGGAFYELIAYDTYLDELANVLKAVELNRGSASISGGSITNDDFGTSPLGSGLGILLAAGAGYAVVRRKRSRRNTTLLLACVLLLGFTQCKKEQIEPQGGKVSITLNVENGASTGSATDGAKVVVDPPHVTFEDGDEILVVSNGHYVGTLTHDGTNFSGSITDPVEGQPLYFYFVGNKNPEWATSGDDKVGCTVNISDQTTELPVISMAPSTMPYSSTEDTYTASLHNKASLMKFSVTTPSNSPICITGMKNKVIIDFSEAANDGANNGFTYDKVGDGIIKMIGGSGSPAEKWAIVLQQDALAEGEAYSEDYYVGTRPALSAISINQYLDSGVSMTVNSKWNGDLSSLSGSVSERYTTATDGMTITGTFQNFFRPYKISIAAGATVTLNGVDINSSGWTSGDYAGLSCLGDATIILSGTNTVMGFASKYPGIHIPSGKTLTIQGTGTLNASSNSTNSYAAGIGGGNGISCGNIIINSGTVTATCGGYNSAGIGGGDESSCGNITINGGTVTATGGDSGAGIGGGRISSCGDITINGGTVTATGGDSGAGIGSGFNESSCGNITISGGTVEATGGENAAGIGGGEFSPCNAITIENTVTSVTATKGDGAYNSIGKGYQYRACGTVTIGGTVYYNGSSYQNDGGTYLATSPLVYAPNPITPPTPPTPPSGANVFTVSNDHGETTSQVIFSQGNLQYQASTGTWRFAANQYDYIGSDNSNISSSYSGWIDLFGWGTGDNPTKAYADNSYYSTFNDWGTNVIGSDAANTWRTLTFYELYYIIYERPNASNKYAAATVNDVHGMVLLPDSWTLPDGCTFTAGHDYEWSTNTYDVTQWASMEANGAVFLPAAGYRNGTDVYEIEVRGSYWTPLTPEEGKALRLGLDVDVIPELAYFIDGERYFGCSVRLVKDAN